MPTICRRISAIAALMVAISGPGLARQGQSSPAAPEKTTDARLTGTTVTLPIIMVREFPFVEGEVAGVKGRFMLDTGMQEALSINDHRVPIAGGTKVGSGFFGSGQTYDIRLHASVDDVRIGNIRLARVRNVESQNARMLERITPDFIGWIGYDFFKGYALKMDYRRSRATFYSRGPTSYLRGEKVVAVLPFETRHLPNHPLLQAKVGETDAIVTLDTGMYGALYLPEARKAELIAAGYLNRAAKPDAFDLTAVRLNDTIDVHLKDIEVEASPSPAARSIGVTESNELALGYAFLRQFKTVWDFERKRLYLLAR